MKNNKKQYNATYSLINLINKTHKENNDTLIAKALFENRYVLDQYSLDQLSQNMFFSQASISRFIQKMGYKNYNEFKTQIALSNLQIVTNNNTKKLGTPNEIRNSVYQDIKNALESINSIDMIKLTKVLNLLRESNEIYFVGSELSMGIIYLLQIGLISMKKNVYAIYDINYQNETLKKINDDALVICVSLESRWYTMNHFALENILNSNYKTMLWTIVSDHLDNDKFNLTYQFGQEVEDNIGYNELMYFVLLLYRLIINEG